MTPIEMNDSTTDGTATKICIDCYLPPLSNENKTARNLLGSRLTSKTIKKQQIRNTINTKNIGRQCWIRESR